MNVLFPVLVTFFAGMGAGLVLATACRGSERGGGHQPPCSLPSRTRTLYGGGNASFGCAGQQEMSAIPTAQKQESGSSKRPDHDGQCPGLTVVGSWVASKVPSATMGGFSVFMTFLLGKFRHGLSS